MGLIEPGNYMTIAEIIAVDKKEKSEHLRMELLSLKVMNENEVEIS